MSDYAFDCSFLKHAGTWRVGGGAATYDDLHRETIAVAAKLRELRSKGRQETRVVVACRELASFVPALFGVWQAGLAAELPANVQPKTIRVLRENDDVLTVLHDVEHEPGLFVPELRSSASGADLESEGARSHVRDLSPAEVLAVLHTSGTTSAPKVVEKRVWELLGEVDALAAEFKGLGPTFLSTVPQHHLYGLLFGVLLPLRLGRTIIDRRALFPSEVLSVLETFNGRVLVTTPAHLRSFVPAVMPREITAISSGAPLSFQVHLELAFRHHWTTWDVFGSTETGGVALRKTPLSRWRPLPGVTVREAPNGGAAVTSPWAGTRETADRIKVSADGTFEHRGRADAVVKVAGKRLDLSALEAALLRLPGVDDAAVLSEEDDIRGARVTCFVAPDSLDAALLRSWLAEELDPILVPRRILTMARLPREDSGKLKRSTLIELLSAYDEGPSESGGERPSPPRSSALEFADGATPGIYKVLVPRNYAYFDGHFEGFPVLPAVVQLSKIVLPLAKRAFGELGPVRRLKRARFRHPIFPGQVLEVKLERADRRVSFQIQVDGRVVASGALEFA